MEGTGFKSERDTFRVLFTRTYSFYLNIILFLKICRFLMHFVTNDVCLKKNPYLNTPLIVGHFRNLKLFIIQIKKARHFLCNNVQTCSFGWGQGCPLSFSRGTWHFISEYISHKFQTNKKKITNIKVRFYLNITLLINKHIYHRRERTINSTCWNYWITAF